MADKRPTGHKRSKSSLALSMLHRDRSKIEDNEEALNATAGGATSASGSPTTSHHGLSSLLPHRAKYLGTGSEVGLDHGGYQSIGGSRDGTDDVASKENTGLLNTGPTIQQSIRMFRLFEILRSGDQDTIIKAVKESCGRSDHAQALKGTTILHLAVQCAEPLVVEQILAIASSDPDVVINVNAQDKDGNTPLHLAAKLGRIVVVQALLAHQSTDTTILNYQARSPLDLARTPEVFQQIQLARVQFLENQVRILRRFVDQNDYNRLEKLLEDSQVVAVLDINSPELAKDPSTVETGGTLLHEAARRGNIKLIQLLLLNGADPFRRDRKGRLPPDVTKDERTRAILKKSPAAAAAQRGIQEKAILGGSLQAENALSSRESREMKGYLKKWTNYTSGYKLRWFVLEDGVLSYYKHQDDAGSACRGAMNMRIAQLSMSAEDKSRFEIHGKSSIKYHLKANHTVEAKRWFWALNNAIQWAKDEARQEEQRNREASESTRPSHHEVTRREDPSSDKLGRSTKTVTSKYSGKSLVPATSLDIPSNNASHVSLRSSAIGDEQGSIHGSYESGPGDDEKARLANTATLVGDVDDDDEYGDDASSNEVQPASKDAFNITANSANLQLDLIAQVSQALKVQATKEPETRVSDVSVTQAIATYEGAVQSLQAMVGDLLRIARDRDFYWQYRLEREADLRRLWEDSMAKVAKEQEELQGRIGESEEKRKRTKRALRDALDNELLEEDYRPDQGFSSLEGDFSEAPVQGDRRIGSPVPARRKSVRVGEARRKSTIAAFTDLSDSDSDADEEFFDAVGAGEIEVVNIMPFSSPSEPALAVEGAITEIDERGTKAAELVSSFKGYEEPVRKRLKMDADDRPKISLWSILKSMIGKDMTKMTLPVSFNEPTSLLQRVAEDMEYTDLLDTAADRTDSTERMVYVAAFAASEYASTIGRVAKPFNPLLGETYEYARPDKGYRFIIEQVSHHPPIGAAWAESPKWDYYGESAVKSKFYGKSFDINPLGTWFLKLRPISGREELYTWKKVTSSVIGIITGSPTVDNYGLMEIKNHTTGEVCTLDFKARGWTASSAYAVSGKVLSADGKTRWSIGGRWNDKIYARLTPGFESAIEPNATKSRVHEPGSLQAFLVWEANKRPTGIPFNLTPFVLTLNALPEKLRPLLPPTDTRLRPDQRAMEDGQYDLAASEKNRVEEKQRAKRREREAKGEEFVPRWFSKGKCTVTGEEYWISNGEYWRTREDVEKGKRWDNVEDIF